MNIRSILPLSIGVLTVLLLGCGDSKDDASKGGQDSNGKSKGSGAGSSGAGSKAKSVGLARKYSAGRYEGPSPTFDNLNALVADLSTEDLKGLIEEVGSEGHKGLRGWMRVVLYTEWASRDPESAHDHALALVGDGIAWPRQQALYGVFRGWARTDAAAALAAWKEGKPALGPNERPKLSDHWMEHAVREIMQVLARANAQETYSQIIGEDLGDEALIGFFQGLDQRDLRNYAANWAKQWNQRNADLVRALPALKGAHLNLGERVGTVVTTAMAETTLEAAETWLEETGPKDEILQRGLKAVLYENWSRKNPNEALILLENPENHTQQILPRISRGIIVGDASLGPRVMASIKDLKLRESSIRYSIQGFQSGMGGSREFLPVTGDGQQFPDYKASHAALLKTVEAGKFRETRAASFHKLMEKVFAGKLEEN